ncbi:hypothetical protein NE865_09755 [Phthorimaea operculella]|nr:hypothetical protein NE865_09755 [Phthorimaea operculella]
MSIGTEESDTSRDQDNFNNVNTVSRKPNGQDMNTSNSDPISDLKQEMRQLMRHFTLSQKEELKTMNDTLMGIKQSNLDIQTSINSLSEQNKMINSRVTALEEDTKDNRDYIILLEDKLEKVETNNRKANLELKNVPSVPNESKEHLINMILSLAETVNCELSAPYIKDIYRIRTKKSQTQQEKKDPIIIELSSVLKKTELLQKVKQFNKTYKTKLLAKHLGHKQQEETPVFLSENLTPRAARLYFLARDLKKSKEYKFCWTSFGKVFVRESENSPIIHIHSETQAHQLMLKD